MQHPFTPHFAEEAERYDLRFCCEDCGHFDARRERCRHDWPTELHRRRRLEEPGAEAHAQPVNTNVVVFCKEFELA